MIRRGIAAMFATILAISPGSVQAENDGPIATILCYHVVESPADSHFAISREEFRTQMHYLLSAGYNVIPLADLVSYYKGERRSLPERAVVITVDDGWKCTYEIFYQELSRLGLPFTAFLYPKFILGGSYSLSWDQVREMAENGVDIQSHTLSHAHLTSSRSGKEGDEYRAWLTTELSESKRILEDKVGKTVDVLAYPYGDYDDTVKAATREAGYEAGLTCNFGSVSDETDPFMLYRVVIDRSMSFEQFRRHLGAEPLAVADLRPSPGETWKPDRPVVAARIVDPENIDPSSVEMTLLDGRDVPFFYDPRDGSISLVLRENSDVSERAVLVSATHLETGKRLEASWRFNAVDPVRQPETEIVTTRENAGASMSGGSYQ